jgi:pyruvate kinase
VLLFGVKAAYQIRLPEEAVRMMSRILVEAEQEAPGHIEMLRRTPHSMARAAVRLAEEVGASAIVVVTRSGYSARLLASERPGVPVFALTAANDTVCQLALLWGITPVLIDFHRSVDQVLASADSKLLREGLLRAGDTVVFVRWSQQRTRLANFVTLHKIGRKR